MGEGGRPTCSRTLNASVLKTRTEGPRGFPQCRGHLESAVDGPRRAPLAGV